MRKKGILLLIGLVSIIMTSGCISSGTDDVTKDIVLMGEPTGQWSGPPGEWFINGNVRSKTNTPYTNIQLNIVAYDSNNNTVGSKKTTIASMEKDRTGYFAVTFDVTSKPDHVTVTVLNATKA